MSGGKVIPAARWFAEKPSKRWGELFFLFFSLYWMGALVVVLALKMYEDWADVGYMTFAVILAAPTVLYPLAFPCAADRAVPYSQQYWVKANIWQALFSFIGNFYYTQFFFNLLGAKYTLPVTWQLNGVPIALYIITHAYFVSYHAMVTPLLRRYWTGAQPGPGRVLGAFLIVLALAYFTAFMETLTIASFPYYSFEDRTFMYSVGSTFYMLYFVFSFPMFAQLDEALTVNWTIADTVKDAMTCGMAVFIACDAWRIAACYFIPSMSARNCRPPYGYCA